MHAEWWWSDTYSSAHMKRGRCYNQNISFLGKIVILILYPFLQSFVSIGFQLVDGLGSTKKKHATKCPGQKRCPRYADKASPVQLGDISKIHVTVDNDGWGTYWYILSYCNVTHNSISRLDKVKLYLCRETPSRSGIVSTAILHH